jgi:hypothetical protein
MDTATVRAMLEQHFGSRDPDVSHEMYHDDAVLEFPQSGERFVGVGNFRERRSNYPASTKVEFREIGGRDDLWVAEISISYEEGPWNLGVSIVEFRGDRSRVSRSTSPRAGSLRNGGLNGDLRRSAATYERARIVNIHQPAQRVESLFREMLFGNYPDEIRATKPPSQVFQALALIGRALRFKI